MNAVALVAALPAEIAPVVALINRAYRGPEAGPAWTTEADYLIGDRTTVAQLGAEMAARPDATLLLWRDGATLQGCVWVDPIGEGRWYLGSLAIDPVQQSAGRGATLLSAAEAWIAARGGTVVRITVINVRVPLIAWYGRRGYNPTGATEAFPYDDDRFGVPQRDDLMFIVFEKSLVKPT